SRRFRTSTTARGRHTQRRFSTTSWSSRAFRAAAGSSRSGPGRGRRASPSPQRGYQLLGIELGGQLAAVARQNLAPFPDAQIVVGDFEDWGPSDTEDLFDAVVAFTAFHWVAPEVRYAKPARLLREGGALAVVET